MRIRWKMLILLLGSALLPLAIMTVYGQINGRRLGLQLAAKAREELVEAAARELQQLIDSHSALFWQRGEAITMGVATQAREVERLLVAEPPDDPRLIFADEFDSEGDPPVPVTLSENHLGSDGQGQKYPIRVSFVAQSFYLPPGVDRATVADDLARLAPMDGLYKSLHQQLGRHLHWQYTALESGVHSSFPGHGGYPTGFDPRQRAWYADARRDGEATWSVPMVDATSEEVMIPAVAPVYGPDGAFAGVTGTDVPLMKLLDTVQIPADWLELGEGDVEEQPGAEVLICALYPNEQTAKLQLYIWAQQEYEQTGVAWDQPIDVATFEADDPEQQRALMEDLVHEWSRLSAGEQPTANTLRRLDYKGRDFVWAHRQFDQYPEILVAVLVPYDVIVAPAEEAQAGFEEDVLDQLSLSLAFVLVVAGVVTVLAFRKSSEISKPVRKLADTAQRIAAGDLEAKAGVTRPLELGELSQAFDDMIPKLQDRMRLRHSLSLAMEVQQHLLPQQPPDVPGLDIAGKSIYCDETGGDYYDFIELARLGPDSLVAAVGDVTGHGIAAALLMTAARALLRSRSDLPGNLAQVVTDINRHLAQDTASGRFMTLFLLIVDQNQSELRWVSAGHDPAICYDPEADEFYELEGLDLPLGIDEEWQYQQVEQSMPGPDHVMLIGTDGIWEARNSADELYGKDELRRLIRSSASGSAEEISEAITADLVRFRGEQAQMDDVTLVVIKIKARDPAGEDRG